MNTAPMSQVSSLRPRWVRIALLQLCLQFLFVGGWGNIASAYQLQWKDLLSLLQERTPWYRVILEKEVEVFDPFFSLDNGSLAAFSPPLLEEGFQQKVYWKINKMKIIETRDSEKRLLHFFYNYKGDQFEKNLTQDRIFQHEDIISHYLNFLYRGEGRDFDQTLNELGIVNREISLFRTPEDQVLFRIGDPKEGNYLLVDKKRFLILSIHQFIHGNSGKKSHLEIRFKQFKTHRRRLYPEITEYLIDDRLFKRTTITQFQFPRRLPLEELKATARQVISLP